MRFVDLTGWYPSADWLKKAQSAEQDIARLAPEERSKAISAKSAIWRDLKEDLARLTNKKCWYCESRQIRSDNPVDHFRPKGGVVEAPSHPGYWWLAFDWRNYRYACTWCNTRHVDDEHGTAGGKQEHFPLWDEGMRAYSRHDSLAREQPMLLDPTKGGDAALLTFYPDGRPVPYHSQEKQPRLHQRAAISIQIYHLDHINLVEARQDACRKARELIDQGTEYLTRYEATFDDGALGEYQRVADDLQAMMSPRAEYSGAVKALATNYNSTLDWVKALLSTG